MIDSHPASVEDEVERALRLGLATAAQLADRLTRARQDLARDAQHRFEREARQLEARYRAEGASATARLAVLDRPEWWDRATVPQIAEMLELAGQWQRDQPRAAAAVDTIARQVQDRYGIDLHALGADPAEVRAVLARIDLDRVDHATRGKGRTDGTAAAVAAVLRADQRDADLAAADGEQQRADQARQVSANDRADTRRIAGTTAPVDADTSSQREVSLPYDSAERRAGTAAGLRGAGVAAETIAVALRADVANARPAADAAVGSHASAPARPRARGASRSAHRSSRER